MRTLRVTVTVLGAALATHPAAAVEYPMVGTKLVVKATPAPGKIVFVDKQGTVSASPGYGNDPTIVGATFKVFDPATSEAAVFDLPASNWSRIENRTLRFRFFNREAPGGVSPVRSALHSSSVVKVKVRDAGLALPLGAAELHVELEMGNTRWCATFSNPRKSRPGLFIARAQEIRPPSCPDYWGSPSGAFVDVPR